MSTQAIHKVLGYEGKVFASNGLGGEVETIETFTGNEALAQAEAWWDEQLRSSTVNALYLYVVLQEDDAENKLMVKSWSTPYGYDGDPDPDDDDPDYWDPDEWDG